MDRRPAPSEYGADAAGYIALVPETDICAALETQGRETNVALRRFEEASAAFRYAPGKWSVKEVLGHMADSERVFAYRAMAIARAEKQPLPGFDENEYARHSGYDQWSLVDLVAQLGLLRHATTLLFRNLAPQAWDRVGTANNNPVSVRALAYIILGHERHHLKVLGERYLGQSTKAM